MFGNFFPTLLVAGVLFSGSLFSSDAFATGEDASTFSLKDIKGKSISLEDYKGKVVLVNFWATWCEPCQTEMPHLQKIHDEFKDKDFSVLSISIDDARNVNKVKVLIKRGGYTFPVLLDKDTKVIQLYYPEKRLPYTVLIDKQGKVVWTKISYVPGEEVEIRAKVAEQVNR